MESRFTQKKEHLRVLAQRAREHRVGKKRVLNVYKSRFKKVLNGKGRRVQLEKSTSEGEGEIRAS